MPSVTLARPFSSFLISSQLATTCSVLDASVPAKTWGCRWTSLSWTPRATSASVNRALLLGEPGVEDDLEEEVPQLFPQMVAVAVPAPAPVVIGAGVAASSRNASSTS